MTEIYGEYFDRELGDNDETVLAYEKITSILAGIGCNKEVIAALENAIVDYVYKSEVQALDFMFNKCASKIGTVLLTFGE